jgi:hypothetical protein
MEIEWKFAFIKSFNLYMQHMEVEDEARTAIDALNGYNLNGQQMNVEVYVFS